MGLPVEATVSALPSRTFRGRIAFVDPVLDAATRSARVRAELPNAKGELKPGMFADVRIEVPSTNALTIPEAAVIDTGTRRVVYVETVPNTFTPREVRIGEASSDRIAILGGLREGERVVAAANFFIDAQTQLSSGAAAQYSGALDVTTTPEAKTTPARGDAVIKRVIDFSLNNRFAILGLTLLLAAAGIYARPHDPVDAIPDLSENQVIVWADWPGRGAQEIEDQITYPLVREPPGARRHQGRRRATSEFGFSMINVIFDDWIDFYFARQRVLEKLTTSRHVPPR